jgi:hypothetical protein
MNKIISKCGFCDVEKQLCESHIISKFVYTGIKRKEKILIGLDHNFNNIDKTQDGPKEYLFCRECENKRNPFETYFSSLVQKNIFFKPEQKYKIQNLDYSKFKLFIMWNIYAYHVSKMPFYRHFDPYVDDLKDMINRDDPGGISEYGFLLWYLTDRKLDTINLILMPIAKILDNQIVIDFMICGLFFRCLVPGRADPSLCNHFLQKDGSILVEKISLRNALRKIGQKV